MISGYMGIRYKGIMEQEKRVVSIKKSLLNLSKTHD
jgi:hypothetical protein